eukprot:9373088-Pyramimonas_sp.AAC.1
MAVSSSLARLTLWPSAEALHGDPKKPKPAFVPNIECSFKAKPVGWRLLDHSFSRKVEDHLGIEARLNVSSSLEDASYRLYSDGHFKQSSKSRQTCGWGFAVFHDPPGLPENSRAPGTQVDPIFQSCGPVFLDPSQE